MLAGATLASKLTKAMPEDKNEELLVSEHVTVTDSNGKKYNLVVVPERENKEQANFQWTDENKFTISYQKDQIRKLK